MKILIIANGTELAAKTLKNLAKSASFIIAADGGANICLKHKIIPNVIIGDFDSISQSALLRFQKIRQIQIKEQETTDLEKALSYALTFQPDEIIICSLFGNRLDHTFANAVIMHNFASQYPIPLTLYDNSGILTLWQPGQRHLKNKNRKTVSFFSFGDIKNLTLTGFRYELHGRDFLENFIGVSNEYMNSECLISFSKGILFQFEKAES
jgi:thiamine pyrophosphokinase